MYPPKVTDGHPPKTTEASYHLLSTVNLSISQLTLCAVIPLEVNMINSSAACIQSFTWNFPATSTRDSPPKKYPKLQLYHGLGLFVIVRHHAGLLNVCCYIRNFIDSLLGPGMSQKDPFSSGGFSIKNPRNKRSHNNNMPANVPKLYFCAFCHTFCVAT